MRAVAVQELGYTDFYGVDRVVNVFLYKRGKPPFEEEATTDAPCRRTCAFKG